MLRSLHIENVALIKRLDIDFEKGFTVLTGETGAGKSILIDSINLVCGKRVSRDIIRSGESECFVSAVFEVRDEKCASTLREMGVEVDEDEGTILLSRKLELDGHSTAKINLRTVPVSVLKSVSALLISLSEQNDAFSLLNPELHTEYLDRFSQSLNGEFADAKKSYLQLFEIYETAKSELKNAYIDENERRSKLDFLKFQKNEIESAKIKKGEEQNLLAERSVIRNSEIVSKAIRGTCSLLMGSSKPGVYDRLIMSAENVETIADVIPNGKEFVAQLQSLASDVEALSTSLRGYMPRETDDPTALLDRIESRLDVISKIKAKYGETEEDVLLYFEKLEKDISFLEEYEFSIKELEQKVETARVQLDVSAEKLQQIRCSCAEKMSKDINEEFLFLDMKDVLFKVEFEKLDDFNENGLYVPEFFIRTNPGEPFKKLINVASGGELSRVLLALKKTLSSTDGVDTVVFDEIDTGVSGKTSSKIGISIKALSKVCQVICVTHSAQVSAIASHHYKISKTETDGRMYTQVDRLDSEQRVMEISRILGGVTITDHAIETARELISQGLES